MGRKKIQISRITDERNRQVSPEIIQLDCYLACLSTAWPLGHGISMAMEGEDSVN